MGRLAIWMLDFSVFQMPSVELSRMAQITVIARGTLAVSGVNVAITLRSFES
jgi:hypothetical protein